MRDCPFFPVPLPGPALLGPRPADDNCFQAPHGAGKHKFRAAQGGDQRRRQPGQMGAQYIRKKLVSHDEGRRIRRQKRQGFSKGPPPGFQRPGNGRAARDFPDMTKPAAAAVRNKDNGDAVLPEQADPVDLVHFDSYTLTEAGPLLRAEAPVKFDRDANGYGVLCRVGGKSFNRLFFPGQNGKTFFVDAPADADDLRTAAEQAEEPARLRQGTASALVDLQKAVPSLHLDLRYATDRNLFRRPLHQNGDKAYAAPEVAAALQDAAARLAPQGYGLVVYEAYRPWYLSKYAYDLLPADRKGMLPPPKQGEDRNTGWTVDVGLYDLGSGEALPMISDFDEVSLRQYPAAGGAAAGLHGWNHRPPGSGAYAAGRPDCGGEIQYAR